MKRILNILLNTIFFVFIVIVAVTISTIALTRKVNEYATLYKQGISGAIIKQAIPILSSSQGVVKVIHVNIGDEVKKNDVLIDLDNPELRSKVKTLQSFTDNASAQTEAKVGIEELNGLSIVSPVDGVVSDVSVTEGSPVNDLSKVMTLYSNDNVRLLAELTVDQYLAIKQLNTIKAYSRRLNQTFTIRADKLKPDEKNILQGSDNKLGLYFTFEHQADGQSLLNNEQLDLLLTTNEEKINKPIDLFVNFWDGLLLKGSK